MIRQPLPTSAAAEADLDLIARTLATVSAAERDRLVAAEVAAAIGDHRLADAVRWQRVRLRARRLHERGGPGG